MAEEIPYMELHFEIKHKIETDDKLHYNDYYLPDNINHVFQNSNNFK